MPTSGKPVVLGMIAAAVVLTVALGPERAQRIRELARIETDIHEIRGQGASFGQGLPPEACVEEGLTRAASCDDRSIPCSARAGLFLEGCLGETVLPLAFCDGAPSPDPPDWKADETTAWLAARCADAGLPGRTACTRVLHDGLLRACSTAPASDEQGAGGLPGDSLQIEEF